MTKPVLPEDVEKRFDEQFPNKETGHQTPTGEYVWLFNPAVDVRNIKHFLAQELASTREQDRQETIDEVMVLVADEPYLDIMFANKKDQDSMEYEVEIRNQLRAELRQQLEQMKGEK